MSLDDRLKPDDGSFIDHITNKLSDIYGSLGESYNERFSRNLRDDLNLFGTGAFLYGAIVHQDPAAMIGVVVSYGTLVSGNGMANNSLESEMSCEAFGLGRKFYKWMVYSNYNVGVGFSIASLAEIIYGALNDDPERLSSGMSMVGFSVGMLAMSIAFYVNMGSDDKYDGGKKDKDEELELVPAIVPVID